MGWIWYLISKRIGEQQAMDWEEFKKEYPEYFALKRFADENYTNDANLKYIKEMKERYNSQHKEHKI